MIILRLATVPTRIKMKRNKATNPKQGVAYGIGDHGCEYCCRRQLQSIRSQLHFKVEREQRIRLTWSLSIVGIEFGSNAGSYRHFDEEDDRVQQRLKRVGRPGQRGLRAQGRQPR